MAKAEEVARYIINTIPVDNLKLQKLLYYAQAVYLVFNNREPLFSDDIEAWTYGPVVRNIYNIYKKKGFDIIKPDMDQKLKLTDNEIEYIDMALGFYGKFSGPELINQTHQEEPWKNAYDPDNNHSVITKESIYNYYKDLYAITENERQEN